MVKEMKKCLQFCLKLVNATIAVVGIAMILYGVWMIRVWQRDAEGSSDDHDSALPWFIHAFLGIGIALGAIACLGHFAADTANHYCLYLYSVIVFLLIILETAVISDVFLNSDWEKDIPEDPSGRFEDFKDFVKSNLDVCKRIALFIILPQGCSIILATIIICNSQGCSLGPDEDLNIESGEEYNRPNVALLNHPSYVIGAPVVFTDFRSSKIIRDLHSTSYVYP